MSIQLPIKGGEIRLSQGDITALTTDAIVNAANAHLAGGGGVDGAIHRAGGPEIMAECRRISGCPTGGAVATTAGRLAAKHVIHAVAPRWSGGNKGEPELLASAYRKSLELADELDCRTIAFPSLGTGAYGYPVDRAATIALTAVVDYLNQGSNIETVTFVLFSDSDFSTYEIALRHLSDHMELPDAMHL